MKREEIIASYKRADKPGVDIGCYLARTKRLDARGELNHDTARDALYLSQEHYRKRYVQRKSFIVIENRKVELSSLYSSLPKSDITYGAFRLRLKTYERKLQRYRIDHDQEVIQWAKSLETVIWQRVIGSGQAKPYKYEGSLCSRLKHTTFCSLYHFLRKVDAANNHKLIRSRLKQGWEIHRAIFEPAHEVSDGTGCVYRITCVPEQLQYIGITTNGTERRFKEHISEAESGSARLLCKKFREHGEQAFTLDILEMDRSSKQLRELEKTYISQYNTRFPKGLNCTSGGELCRGAGKAITLNGERFESISRAAVKLSNDTNGEVPPHVIESRIRNGEQERLTRKCRRASKHPDAGSPLFRRHRGLVRRNRVEDSWLDYDVFKRDVTKDISFESVEANKLILSKIDHDKLYSATNFRWISKSQSILDRCGRKCTVYGIEYASVQAVARFYRIPASSLRFTIKSCSVGVEGAVRLVQVKHIC